MGSSSDGRDKKYSKLLSLVLRHDPGKIGIELDKAGWADVGKLIQNAQGIKRGEGLNREILERVVAGRQPLQPYRSVCDEDSGLPRRRWLSLTGQCLSS